MEDNKENNIGTGLRTRKSVLKVLAHPANQTKQNKEDKENERATTCAHVRAPLRPLDWSPVPGPSTTNEDTIKLKKFVKNRRVTKKEKEEQKKKEWDIFEDDAQSNDDTGSEEKSKRTCAVEKKTDKSAKRADSPMVPRLVNDRYYNLLKRGRKTKGTPKRLRIGELQEFLPIVQLVERKQNIKRRMVFKDFSFNTSPTSRHLKEIYTKNIENTYGQDHMKYLLAKESRGSVPAIPSAKKACLFDWLMKIHGPGFPEVLQTTCWYLDTYLHSHTVQVEELQVLATACYWISQKLHGTRWSASMLAYCSKHAFTAEALIAAEEMVLIRLNFPPQPVVPHDFITSICWGLDERNRNAISMAAIFLCMAGKMANRVLCTEFPSVVAAASLLSAIQLLRKNKVMAQLQRSPVYEAAVKKATDMRAVCSALKLAVRMVIRPTCQYNAAVRLYGRAPYNVARKATAWAYAPAVHDDFDKCDKMTK